MYCRHVLQPNGTWSVEMVIEKERRKLELSPEVEAARKEYEETGVHPRWNDGGWTGKWTEA